MVTPHRTTHPIMSQTPPRALPFGTLHTTPLTTPKREDASSAVTVQSPTSPEIVPPHATPMDHPVIYKNRNPQVYDRVAPASATVSCGTALPDVSYLRVGKAIMPAPCVGQPLTTLSVATPSPSLLFVNTPFIPDQWERLLNKISPFNKFADVPISLHSGFDMGVHSPPTFTYTPPNHNSALSYPNHVLSHIHKELSLCCYSGPFSCSRLKLLIGPFRTSPLGTVPKSHDSTERRVVQDLSFPRNDPSHTSVNTQIDINDFRCDWGTFNDIRFIVMDAPPGTEAVTLDVDSAFRCCPILPSQQSSFIIHWNNSFFIDHNAPFGATSAGSVFGRVADAMSAILFSKDLGP